MIVEGLAELLLALILLDYVRWIDIRLYLFNERYFVLVIILTMH